MKTSNFASVRKLLVSGETNLVSIARSTPKWFNGRGYIDLAPSWKIIRLPEPQYKKEYAKALSRLDPEKVYRDLGEDAVLLCYEKPGDFCHRRMVAKWLEEELGIEVTELQRPTQPILPKKETKKRQETRAEISQKMEMDLLTKNQISLF